MRRWEDRPQEVAHLLNPAFCGQVIYECAVSYAAQSERGMPYALAFLVLPIVLHPGTQQTMNSRTRHFLVWVNSNQHIKVGLAERARSLIPYSREAMTFLYQMHIVAISAADASLSIVGQLRQRHRRVLQAGDDTRACLGKSAVLGKWFARVNSPATIYASLGLMP
jgi:hypothetical protein